MRCILISPACLFAPFVSFTRLHSPARRPNNHRHPFQPETLGRRGTRCTTAVVGLAASDVNGEGGQGGAGNEEEGARPEESNVQQQQRQSTDDSDAPIFYIKGLKEGGGVGVWGDDVDGSAGGRGDAGRVEKAMRNAAMGEEAAYDEVEGEGRDETPLWDKVQASLGLGFWSYAGLGLALFIIVLNNWLGVGWLGRAINPDFDTEGMVNVERQTQQVQVMPLDDPSNLLSP